MILRLLRSAALPLSASLLGAAEPSLTHIHPAGVQAGTTGKITLNGKFDPWPCQIHTDTPGLTFVPGKDAGTFELMVADAVPPGPHLVRAFNHEGASAPVALVITRGPQTGETEPNDDARAPQSLTDGGSVITVNGRLDKMGDVDSYGIHLKKDRTLVAWVEAHVLAAGFDPMLRVTDSSGSTLAFQHDGPSSMDPLLVFTAPSDDRYTVQIMGHRYPAASDIRFEGGPDCLYRLHLSSGPVIRNLWPLAAPAGHCGPANVEGWNLPGASMELSGEIPVLFPAPVSVAAEFTETDAPPLLPVPSAVSGRIATPREEDRYTFNAVKGESLELEAAGPALGSAIDPWIKLTDSQGRELAVNDDGSGGGTESRLRWSAPEDGTYTAVIGDLTQNGGPDYYYRLFLSRPAPSVKAIAAAHSFKLEAGKTSGLKVTVTPAHGFSGALRLAAAGLPAGVEAPAVEVPAAGGEVTLTLSAAPETAPVSGPFRLFLTETAADAGAVPEHPVQYRLSTVSENNGVPQGYRNLMINDLSTFWLTLLPAPAPAPAAK